MAKSKLPVNVCLLTVGKLLQDLGHPASVPQKYSEQTECPVRIHRFHPRETPSMTLFAWHLTLLAVGSLLIQVGVGCQILHRVFLLSSPNLSTFEICGFNRLGNINIYL